MNKPHHRLARRASLRALILGSVSLAGLNIAAAQTTAPAAPAASAPTAPAASAPTAPAATAPAAPAATAIELQPVVVTGTSAKTKKFRAPYAISTLNKAALQRLEPKSLVDALRALPGVNVENSGGEGGGENVVIRGLPWSGFRLLDVQEDGLPLFESNYERELQIDELFRIDLNTKQAELVRGGTAPVYGDNASGGVLNLVTNNGTPTLDHELKFTTGLDGQTRGDFELSGPSSDPNLLYSVSGYYNRDNSLRKPGFSGADQGGQFKAGATYLLPNGQVFANVKYLNDRDIFYSDIPLINPNDGSSLNGLINESTGTLDSNHFQKVTIWQLNGAGGAYQRSYDLANGVHPEVKQFTAGGDFDLGDGWHVSDHARYAAGVVAFDAIYSGTAANAATNLAGYLAGAKKAFAGTTSVRYVYAGTNTIFNPATTGNLTMTNTWESTTTKYTEAVNDLRVLKTFDVGALGTHDLSAGLFLNRYSLWQQQIGSTILDDVKSAPDALDVQALNAAGQVTGLVTQNGFTAYGSGDLIGDVHGVAAAPYAADTLHITDAWTVDAGIRHEFQWNSGNRGIIGTQRIASTGPLAAQTVTGVTGYAHYNKFLDGTSWTAGTSYLLTPALLSYVRYSSSYSLPRRSDFWGNINNGVAGTLPNGAPVPTTTIRQAEGGLKYSVPGLQLSLIGFYSHFNDLNTSTYVANAQGILSNQSLLLNTTTIGAEFEGSWQPCSFFEADGSFTIQDPHVTNANTFNTISAASVVGAVITRTPKQTFTITPTYLFSGNGYTGQLFTTVYYESQRFQDFTNTSVLPAFASLDAGVSVHLKSGLTLELLGTNLSNSNGLTEGNARAPVGNAITVSNATTGRPIFGRTLTASALYKF
jgi:outer membrane receptor protein involved in Fe transport